jgi:hypothetical protein
VIAGAVVLLVVAAAPLAALGLRERARDGDGDASAARQAMALQPGERAVRAMAAAYDDDRDAGARQLASALGDGLRHDTQGAQAVLDVAQRWNDDQLAERAERRLHAIQQ